MEHVEFVLFFLLLYVAALTSLARATGLPYPILLVVGCGAVGFAPGVPDVSLNPDLVLVIFLPPLLFYAGLLTSVRDLRANMRTITLSAVGLVLLTAALVAVVAHSAVEGLPWAAAFALGAIVSPTDPLAAVAITSRLGIPSRLTAVIEGESLINDGTALMLYRTAVAAAVGASFDLLDALGAFVVSVVGGILVGVVAAEVTTRAMRRVVNDDLLGVTFALIAGYLAYLPAEQLGVSGVLAAVTLGLIVGRRVPTLSTSSGRLRGYAFWEVLVFLVNAALFVLVGLQLPGVLASQQSSTLTLAALASAISVTVIGARLIWLNPTPFVIRAPGRRSIQVARREGWRLRMVSAWSGMRGAVSLAAALALPETVPERDLLLFLTYAVIVATLVGQGLTLPSLIRRLGVEDDGIAADEELVARRQTTSAALDQLEHLGDEQWARDETVERIRDMYEFRHRRLTQRAHGTTDGDEDAEARSQDDQRVVHSVIEAQRRRVVALRDAGEISDSVMRRIERELDLEEQRLDA